MPRPKRSYETSLSDALNNRYLEPVRKTKKKRQTTYERIPLPMTPSQASPGPSTHRNISLPVGSLPTANHDPTGPSMDDVQVHNLGSLPVKGKVGIVFLPLEH